MGPHMTTILLSALTALLLVQTTVAVFKGFACEGRTAFLSCPPSQQVRVRNVFYGRNDSVTCLDSSRDSDGRCAASNAVAPVAPLCGGRRECQVRASDELFGTPSGCEPDTSKFMLLDYECERAQYTALLCEGSGRLQLTCPAGQVIEIHDAFFGREDMDICPHPTARMAADSCSAPNAVDVVNITCRGLQECELISRSGVFSDPCPGSFKYLRVSYFCIDCVNEHMNETQCEQWALQGECANNEVWMYRNCRRSCLGCSRETPECSNIDSDENCNQWAAQGDCERGEFVAWMYVNCRRSCTRCDGRATCQNSLIPSGNQTCERLAEEGGCTNNTDFMLKNCAGTCLCHPERRFSTTPIECRNQWPGSNPEAEDNDPEQECLDWVAAGQCQLRPGFMYAMCYAACSNCSRATDQLTYCENRAQDVDCDLYADQGECTVNPLWMLLNCWRSCTRCQPTPRCENLHGNDAECEYWRSMGRCHSNAVFMRNNCWRTCSRCEVKSLAPVCNNDYGVDADCDRWRDDGDCVSNPSWMIPYCRQSCTFCAHPFIQLEILGNHPAPGDASLVSRGRTLVLGDTFQENATLTHWTGFFVNRNMVSLEIWRPAANNTMDKIYSMMFTPYVTNGPETVPVDRCVEVRVGDRVGFSSVNNLLVPVAYRFDLAALRTETLFRYVLQRRPFNRMKLPYVFALGVAFDYTKTECS